MNPRRLRPVPEHAPPILIDPPKQRARDDWREGWLACAAVAAPEIDEAYERGLRARPVAPSFHLDPLALAAAFILGMLAAAAIHAAVA